jgi:hypothetical protein
MLPNNENKEKSNPEIFSLSILTNVYLNGTQVRISCGFELFLSKNSC